MMKNLFSSLGESVSEGTSRHGKRGKNDKCLKVHRVLIFCEDRKSRNEISKRILQVLSETLPLEEENKKDSGSKKFLSSLTESIKIKRPPPKEPDLTKVFFECVSLFNINVEDLNLGVEPDDEVLKMKFSKEGMARLLFKFQNFERMSVAEYLCLKENTDVLRMFMQLFLKEISLRNDTFYYNFVNFFRYFRTPKDGNKVFRLLETFCEEFKKSKETPFTADQLNNLGCSILMLHTDIHRVGSGTFLKTFMEVNIENGFTEDTLVAIAKHVKKKKPLDGGIIILENANFANFIVYHKRKYFEIQFIEGGYKKIMKNVEEHLCKIHNAELYILTTKKKEVDKGMNQVVEFVKLHKKNPLLKDNSHFVVMDMSKKGKFSDTSFRSFRFEQLGEKELFFEDMMSGKKKNKLLEKTKKRGKKLKGRNRKTDSEVFDLIPPLRQAVKEAAAMAEKDDVEAEEAKDKTDNSDAPEEGGDEVVEKDDEKEGEVEDKDGAKNDGEEDESDESISVHSDVIEDDEISSSDEEESDNEEEGETEKSENEEKNEDEEEGESEESEGESEEDEGGGDGESEEESESEGESEGEGEETEENSD